MERFTIPEICSQLYIPHLACSEDVEGVYDLVLDFYQIDELETNGYTLAADTCRYCQQPSTFLLWAMPQGFDPQL